MKTAGSFQQSAILHSRFPMLTYDCFSALLQLALLITVFAATQAQIDCITQPQDSSCKSFTFPNPEGLVDNFCGMMPNMPGCSIRDICKTQSYNASTHNDGVCTYFSLAEDLCADMPGMERQACNNLTSMCHPTTGVSQVQECETPNLVPVLPTFMTTKKLVTQLCNVSAPSQALCDQCIPGFQCDLLSVYAQLCQLAPARNECAKYQSLCAGVEKYGWPLCPAAPMAPMAMPAAPSTPSTPYCVTHPTNTTCKDYRIPDPAGVLADMCTMDSMPACSVSRRVCSQSEYSSSPFCATSSLMADACTDMTMGVTGCVNYVQMCVSGSVIAECYEPSLKNVLPTYKQAKNLVNDICTSMSMSDCKQCESGSCDYLSVYSDLCLAMPNMQQCGMWKSFCAVVPSWPYCSATASGVPEMRMYFHTGLVDYVLFQGWVPRTGWQYALTWFAILLAAFLLEAIKLVRARCERKWAESKSGYHSIQDDDAPDVSGSQFLPAAPWSIRVDLSRSGLAALELAWGYMLMLVAMTFNVGLFLAVIAGCFFGTLVFGRFLAVLPKPKTSSCH